MSLEAPLPLIAVIGDVNVDLAFAVPSFPTEGDDVSATALAWLSGGAGLNIAVALAQLGARVRLLARVGTDPAATIALSVATHAGVDLRFVQHDEHFVTGMCAAVVNANGERTFICFRGANVNFVEVDLNRALADCRLLVVSAHALLEGTQRATTLHAIDRAKSQGIAVALDLCLPAIRSQSFTIQSLLPLLQLITLNEQEAHLFLPHVEQAQILEYLLAAGVSCAALKRGAHGCTVAVNTHAVTALPPSIPVVDTTGCGDAFTAALIWALLQHADLAACAALANTCGALTATRSGGAAAIPDRQTLRDYLSPSLHYLLP
jgi:ribokinase